MARTFEAVALLATALCFASLLGFAHCSDFLLVEGKVYCDTCRIQFETKLSEYLSGATVRLECHNRETGNNTFAQEAVTDAAGAYKISVEGDHEDDICEVKVLKSPNEDCAEIMEGRDRARVVITKNSGVVSADRLANSLGFMKKEALSGCVDALKELGFLPLE